MAADNPKPIAGCSLEDSDVLIVNPVLDYLNEILMEEGMDDATCLQQVDDASYEAIFNSFYDIIGEQSMPNDLYVTDSARRRDHTRQEQGNDKFKRPTADHEGFPAKLADVNLSFEDLKLDDVYTALYVEEPASSSTIIPAAKDSKHNGDKKKSMAEKASKFGRKHTSDAQIAFVDVRDVLVSCAQAVEIGDVRGANRILQELRQVHGASVNGTGLQRTAHFFSKALAARLRGMGEQELTAISASMPSAASVLWASKLHFEVSPFFKLLHYFANQSILKAAEGASRLHIVDYGLMHGMQWPCLINALADRKEGPPLLVITGIECLRTGSSMAAERLDESGRRLAAYARSYNVPFQYHAIVSNRWEDLDPTSLHCHEGEVLVVNCIKRLNGLRDDSADSSLWSMISPRQKLLNRMRSLEPHLLVTAVSNAASNSPFFVSRFREALYNVCNRFDMLETLWGGSPERLVMERSCFYRDIMNIVACEGAERSVGWPETYRQWDARIAKAGFQHLPIPAAILARSTSHVKKHYHKDIFIQQDEANAWMLMGWKGRPTFAISAWKPHRL